MGAYLLRSEYLTEGGCPGTQGGTLSQVLWLIFSTFIFFRRQLYGDNNIVVHVVSVVKLLFTQV